MLCALCPAGTIFGISFSCLAASLHRVQVECDTVGGGTVNQTHQIYRHVLASSGCEAAGLTVDVGLRFTSESDGVWSDMDVESGCVRVRLLLQRSAEASLELTGFDLQTEGCPPGTYKVVQTPRQTPLPQCTDACNCMSWWGTLCADGAGRCRHTECFGFVHS